MHMNDIGFEIPQASAHRLFGGKTVYATEKGSNIPQSHTWDLGTAAAEITNLMPAFCQQSRKALYYCLFAAEFAVFIMYETYFHDVSCLLQVKPFLL